MRGRSLSYEQKQVSSTDVTVLLAKQEEAHKAQLARMMAQFGDLGRKQQSRIYDLQNHCLIMLGTGSVLGFILGLIC